MDSTGAHRPEPHEVACLRGGPRAAVTVAVLALRLRGAVGPAWGGALLRATGPLGGPGADRGADAVPALLLAVHEALRTPASLRDLMVREGVALALIDLRYDLTVSGLTRIRLPGRTRAGRRALRSLRERHPLPEGPGGLAPEERLLAVALYGDRALVRLMPRFAHEGGLTGRRGRPAPRERGSSWDGGAGGFGCGTE